MIADQDLVRIHFDGSPYIHAPCARTLGEDFLEKYGRWPEGLRRARMELVPVPSCRCCGAPAAANLRCGKHQDRNPCAAEGCRRTRAANGNLSCEASLCGEHWRKFVPPGSPLRRSFNRLARLARRLGYQRAERWPEPLEGRWWRLWRGVIRRVNGGADGYIDRKAVDQLFGWDIAA